ncbi:hypothetical protein IV203_003004 [Nitzschia inconspicua]|uniref:Uncharacterized protein n=1 Tax=Nitzschia inconspicua TaxID=303405 RepID=A0A9K3L1U2_9STRA|nr:hypothetical protein IV203_003004 [Nitzschia inconspicua]
MFFWTWNFLSGTSTKNGSSPIKASAADKVKNGGNTDDAEIRMLEYLYDMYDLGIEEIPEKDVLMTTAYSRTDSTGDRNIIKSLIKDRRIVEKNFKKLRLTEAGMKVVEKLLEGPPKLLKKSNKGIEKKFKNTMLKMEVKDS